MCRNELTEPQITDARKLRRAAETMPRGRFVHDTRQGPLDPLDESDDHVVERTVGTFLSDSTHPTLIPGHCFMATVCRTGNCTPAMYCAWEPIVRCENDAAQVNLLLNRASPWPDADSYLPSEGKVMIHNKQARRLAVRVPRWVDRDAVRIEADGRAATPFRVEGHLVFSALRQRATVTITFPVVEAIETYTLKWKQSEFWQESNCPGHTWEPAEEPARYTCRFRGNTLAEITPRDQGPGYPLYQRDALRQTVAPTRHVTRFVAAKLVVW